MRRVVIALVLFPLLVTGCAIYTINTWRNEPLKGEDCSAPIAASDVVTSKELESRWDGLFFGIAMSGGGSRAANFSAAVLQELDEVGLLEHVTALSSVSGSSLTAAYYGLFRKDGERWRSEQVRKVIAKNYEARWMGSWLLPWNIARYWTTNFSRSDIMERVLDSNLFSKRKFRDMPTDGPRILINATSFTTGERFVFSCEKFRDDLRSRLSTLPVSHAVMASGAFPFAFHDVTLRNNRISKQQHYEHLFDGGPADNLGIMTLLDMVRGLYKESKGQLPRGCVLMIVDAYTYQELPQRVLEVDTRKPWDFIFDTNVIGSSDVLLSTRRIDLLRRVGIDVGARQVKPYVREAQVEEGPKCVVWDLTFQRLLSNDLAGKSSLPRQVGLVVNAIPTRYQLTGVEPYKPETLQDYIYAAARILV